MGKRTRPDIDTYFLLIAGVVSTRSTCLHRQVGAVIVQNRYIIATGYNGAPAGMDHCLDVGCSRDGIESGTRHELCRAVHAEQNAIIQAAVNGATTSGATIYCTHRPCVLCSKMLINAGIKKVVYQEDYPCSAGKAMLERAGIELVRRKC